MIDSKLKKLTQKWYKKLAKSGFKDIEDVNSPNEHLKVWDSLYFLSRYNLQQFEAKAKYFTLTRQFLNTHVFETSRDKDIWGQYSDGLSIRAISRKRRVPFNRIYKLIKELEGIMLGRRNG